MKNKKEILLEMLRGSIEGLNKIPDLVKDIDVYTESGHVDTDFFTSALVCVNKFMDVSNLVVSSLSSMLAPDATKCENKNKQDDGKKWNVDEILKNCVLEDNVMRLPKVQFNKKSYAEAKKWIEEAGGSWAGGKVQGFVFPFDAKRVFGILNSGKRCNLKQDFQFFETPSDLSDWIVQLAGGVEEGDHVLEPSAGQGGIINAIHRSCPNVVVDCFELMPENKEILLKLKNINLIGDDFTKGCPSKYNKIIANPPFAKNQDIKHVRMMYERLEQGGILVSIMSKHWTFSDENICIDFRNWLKDVKGTIHNISSGEFVSSGTNIETVAIVIKK